MSNVITAIEVHRDILLNDLNYSPKSILGVFCYGSQNYGLANKNSDVDTVAIYLPTFEEMCLCKERLSKEFHLPNGEHIVIKDIREYSDMLSKQNINFLETLYTQFYWLNDEYAQIFTELFINKRDIYSSLNIKKMYTSIAGQIIHTVKQDPADNKKLSNGYRLLYLLENFEKTHDYESSLSPIGKEHDFLWNLKYNKSSYTEKEKLDMAYAIIDKALAYQQNYSSLKTTEAGTALRALQTATVEILRKACAINTPRLTRVEFEQYLTNAESTALVALMQSVYPEGNISINKAIEQYHISRPVFTSLLEKMEKYDMAEIKKQGVKGTYIKFKETK